jgi:FAD/FMN-containing dehydrogenase
VSAAALLAALEAAGVRTEGLDALRDVSGLPLGRPAAVVAPDHPEGVVAVVSAARAAGVRVAVVGATQAYWRPLSLDGVLALRVDRLRSIAVGDGVVRVGAGAAVRDVDATLRAVGRHLPFRPDAFGDSTVGGMVAAGSTSGWGMGLADVDRSVVQLDVVDGRGLRWSTGASGAWPSLPPFLRPGVPDATGLFLAAEGSFGVVVGVTLRAPPAPWRVRLTGHVALEGRARLATSLRPALESGLLETAKIVAYRDGAQTADRTRDAEVELWVASPWSSEEALARAAAVAAAVSGLQGIRQTVEDAEARSGRGPLYEATWQGPASALRAYRASHALLGMDVNADWSMLEALLASADDELDAQDDLSGLVGRRAALYLAPGFLNLGLHTTVLAASASAAQQAGAQTLSRWSSLPVIPYRVGRSWPDATLDGIDAPVASVWQGLREVLDPDGVFVPTSVLRRGR